MPDNPLLDAIDLDDEEQVIHLLRTTDSKLSMPMVNSKLSLPGWSGFTLLHWAAQRGHVSSVSLLLEAGASVDSVDDAGDTPLHHAARSRRTAVVELLLRATRLFNARNKDGDTPLHLAAESGAAKVVKMISIVAASCVNEQNNNGDTPLHLATRFGNVLAVKLLLTCECTDPTIRNNEEDTVLHLAVISGKLVSVEALLLCKDAPVLLDSRNKARLTPLLVACSCKFTQTLTPRIIAGPKPRQTKEIVELLLHEGADITARDKEGHCALHIAALHGNVDAISALLGAGNGTGSPRDANPGAGGTHYTCESEFLLGTKDRLRSAKSKKKAEMENYVYHALEMDEVSPSPNLKEYFYSTEWRLNRVPSSLCPRVNLPNKDGESALHLAARLGHRSAAETLLSFQADPNQLNKYFDGPIDYAFEAGHDDIVAILMRNGADITDRIKHALVKLAAAEVRKNPLLPKPREWDLQDLYLLHTTAMSGRTRILDALLDQSTMDVNARNEWKQTPLHCAAILGKTAVVMSLVKRREVRANAGDRRGKTALQYAIECKHSEVEKLLLERAEVREILDRMYRDRQVYVDAANAILVGAALIGGVTYSGWLQPPLGYIDRGYTDISSMAVRIFCVFNSVSFCFSMCTVLAGAGAVLPCPDAYIATVVRKVRRALALAALLMVISILSVLGAFAAAGFAIVEKPRERHGSLLMSVSMAPGIFIAVGLTFWFIMKMAALLPHRCTSWVHLNLHFPWISTSIPIDLCKQTFSCDQDHCLSSTSDLPSYFGQGSVS
ncbi:hypothetical protein KP509_30G035700 [Ceratopteris richardii]|uniref:PGG domain-containing protein n=1 Tax=Ceratopteris richardii TaxID=49495 RepID=A0A8T2R1D6_CERRI|nr:hypothetical protein KP509_30G035700 [Ceratopteris richardii]